MVVATEDSGGEVLRRERLVGGQQWCNGKK